MPGVRTRGLSGTRHLARNTRGAGIRPATTVVPSWDPSQLPNLVAWYDASNLASITASGGAVSQWNDLSGGGWHLTQPTGGSQPLTATDTINTKNAIKFDGSNDFMANASIHVVQPCTILLVAKNLVAPGGQHEAVIFDNGDGRIYADSGDKISIYGRGVPFNSATTWGTSGPHNVVAVLNATNSTVQIDGGTTSSPVDVGPGPDGAGNGIHVGSYLNGGLEFWQGDIAEIVVLSASIGSTDRTSWNTYSLGKWGV